MLKIYDTLKSLIGPELVSKAATTLGESNSKVSTAVSAIIPSLLGSMIKNGNTAGVKDAVEYAGKSNLFGDLNGLFSGNCLYNNVNVGEKFTNALLGNKSSDFVSAIAAKAGMPTANAGKLTSWVSAAIAAFLGNRMSKHNDSMSDIISALNNEKSEIMNDIPSNIYSTLGLSPVVDRTTTRTTEPVKKKNGNGWIIWLIIILLLLLLLFFWWRSCNRNRATNDYRTNNVIERVDTAVNRTTNAVREGVNTAANRVRTELTLPDGRKINVYKGGCEDKMLTYLKSDDYRNASDNDLKNKWFTFDNIEFEFNSADDLTSGSTEQLNNLVQIMKSYPDVKIRIGGEADRVGSEEINMEISKARANYIKSYFERNGINGSRIDTLGFGEEYAQYSENAPDSLRVQDRNIALRLVK